jgi:hypothetical protein
MYRDTTTVGHEMYGYTGNNWSHRYSNRRFEEKCGSHIRKTFNKFTTRTAILGASYIKHSVLQSET